MNVHLLCQGLVMKVDGFAAFITIGDYIDIRGKNGGGFIEDGFGDFENLDHYR